MLKTLSRAGSPIYNTGGLRKLARLRGEIDPIRLHRVGRLGYHRPEAGRYSGVVIFGMECGIMRSLIAALFGFVLVASAQAQPLLRPRTNNSPAPASPIEAPWAEKFFPDG